MTKYLTAADVTESASPYGLTAKQLRNWCDGGHIAPTEGGDGTGDHRKFSLMQAVGVAVAAHVYYTERGCAMSYVRAVVATFTVADETWMKNQFAAGRTHLAHVYGGVIKLQGKQYDWPDVGAIHRDILAKVAEIEARPAIASSGGRKRGLAASAD